MIELHPSDVRLRFFEDCPNWRVAEARLKEALARVGADPDAVVCEQVTTLEQAAALGFQGSPTILVDGTDPFAEAEAPAGLTCRIYRTAMGVQPAPTVEQLQAALTLAGCRPHPQGVKLMASAPDLFDDADLSEPVARTVRSIAVLGFQALWSGRSVTLTELLGEDGAALTEATDHLRSRGRIERQARVEAEDERRRLAFLAEASRVLFLSLALETTLDTLARLAVPYLADWCAITVSDPNGTLRRAAVAAADPATEVRLRPLQDNAVFDPTSPSGVHDVVRSGRPARYETVSDAVLRRIAPDGTAFDVARQPGVPPRPSAPSRPGSGPWGPSPWYGQRRTAHTPRMNCR